MTLRIEGENMEIVLQIKIFTKDNQIVQNYSKKYESQSLPNVGMKIKDDLFAEPKNIIDVLVDYSRNQCFVTLEPREETKERLDNGHIQEVAKMHNWLQMEH